MSTAPHAPPWTHLTLWARLRTQERRLSSLHVCGGLRVSGAIDPFDHTRHVWAINSGWGPPPAHADAAPGVVDAVLHRRERLVLPWMGRCLAPLLQLLPLALRDMALELAGARTAMDTFRGRGRPHASVGAELELSRRRISNS